MAVSQRSRQLVIEATMNEKGVVTGAKKIETTTEKMGRTVSNASRALAAVGIGFSVSTIVSGMSAAIGAASDLGESVNAVQVATGDAADEILAMGERSAETWGLSQRALNDTAVAFSAFLEKIDPDNIPNTFEDLVTRGTDFASVMNLDVNEAMDKFRSGLAGESEPLRAFGIDLSAAAVGAYAVANGLVASASEMTESDKVAARYGLLMQQTAKFQGDFANTSESAANQQRILNARMENAAATIGDELLPAWTNLLETGVDMVPVFTVIAQKLADVAADAADTVQPVLDVGSAVGEAAAEADNTSGWTRFGDALDVVSDNAFGLTNRLWSAGPGSLAGAFRGVHEWLSATDEEMGRIQQSMSTNTMEKFVEDTEEVAYWLKKAHGEGAIFGQTVADVTDEADGAGDAIAALADETRKLIDPVFRARKAEEAFNEALVKAREDSVLTEAELSDLADKYLDLQAANEAVTPEAMEAYGVAVQKVKDEVINDLDELDARISTVGQGDSIGELSGFISRLEDISGSTIHIDLSSLRVATQADIEHAVTDAIYRLQRSGKVTFIPL